MKRPVIATIAGLVAVASVGIGGIASAANKAVTLTVDGEQQTVHVWGSTVQDALDAHQITLAEHDEVSPAASDTIADGTVVEVKYARPLTVIIDGVAQTIWTTATSLDDALAEIGLHDPEARLSIDRSAPLGRDGLMVSATTPKNVQVTAGGTTQPARTTASDVASLLNELGIRVDADDRVSPGLGTTVTEGLVVQLQRVDITEATETKPVDYQTISTPDANLAKDVTKVNVEGKAGEKTVIWRITSVDGVEESRAVVSEEITTAPVDKQVSVGTRPTNYSGSHADWMAAAGIAESDWSAAEILIQRESSWNPNAVNSSSGACGLVQSLPCSKLGANWNDPVVALKWGDQYVKSRYGGWQQALAHSYANGWY